MNKITKKALFYAVFKRWKFNHISKQKTEKWTTKEKFNALGDLRDIDPGTEYNLTGAIEEGELDSALQAKINGKLTAPTTPTAGSAIVLGSDGVTTTKLLSEIGGGKLYRHFVRFYFESGYIGFYFYSSEVDKPYTDSRELYKKFPGIYVGLYVSDDDGSGSCLVSLSGDYCGVEGAMGNSLNELTFVMKEFYPKAECIRRTPLKVSIRVFGK